MTATESDGTQALADAPTEPMRRSTRGAERDLCSAHARRTGQPTGRVTRERVIHQDASPR